MKLGVRFGLAFAAAICAAPAVAPAQSGGKAAPAAKDWTKAVALTPEGGFRMGNPNAKVKLVEYGSLTCPTCAEFSRDAGAPLKQLVRSGQVSFEFRNMVLNAADLSASLVARCAGPANFFPLAEKFYATQPVWLDKVSTFSRARQAELKAMPNGQRLLQLAQAGGLMQMAAEAGVTPQRSKQCLTDEAGLKRLAEMREAAASLGVTGTPTFFLNGGRVQAHHWHELEPLIRGAAG